MTLTPTSADRVDAQLITRTREGDVEAYSMLFERHRDAATRLARQLARGPGDADDLVAESFERVLRQLREGKGPDVSFRAYLLTIMRNLHYRRHRADKRTVPTDDLHVLDRSTQDDDRVLTAFDNAAAGRAFRSLPERWQMVLWHLEVEGERPAQVAALLGMKPNAVSALAYRAREGLRQAYLTEHVAAAPDETHAAVLAQLPALVRRRLGRRDAARVRSHLDECRSCFAAFVEMRETNSRISALVAPVVLGAAATGYLRGAPAPLLRFLRHPYEWVRHWIHFHSAQPTTATTAVKGVAAVGVLTTSAIVLALLLVPAPHPGSAAGERALGETAITRRAPRASATATVRPAVTPTPTPAPTPAPMPAPMPSPSPTSAPRVAPRAMPEPMVASRPTVTHRTRAAPTRSRRVWVPIPRWRSRIRWSGHRHERALWHYHLGRHHRLGSPDRWHHRRHHFSYRR